MLYLVCQSFTWGQDPKPVSGCLLHKILNLDIQRHFTLRGTLPNSRPPVAGIVPVLEMFYFLRGQNLSFLTSTRCSSWTTLRNISLGTFNLPEHYLSSNSLQKASDVRIVSLQAVPWNICPLSWSWITPFKTYSWQTVPPDVPLWPAASQVLSTAWCSWLHGDSNPAWWLF